MTSSSSIFPPFPEYFPKNMTFISTVVLAILSTGQSEIGRKIRGCRNTRNGHCMRWISAEFWPIEQDLSIFSTGSEMEDFPGFSGEVNLQKRGNRARFELIFPEGIYPHFRRSTTQKKRGVRPPSLGPARGCMGARGDKISDATDALKHALNDEDEITRGKSRRSPGKNYRELKPACRNTIQRTFTSKRGSSSWKI